MANVYTFKVRLDQMEDVIWRDIEITSVSSVAKLCYTILAAFGAKAEHLFSIEFSNKRYEADSNSMEEKLDSLSLKIGDALVLEYDYGAGWKFYVELISVSELKRGYGTHYPYISAGAGKGIIENLFPSELLDYIQISEGRNMNPKFCDENGNEIEWNYRDFDLKVINALLKGDIQYIEEAYKNN